MMLNIDNIVWLDQEVKKERYRKLDVRVSKKKQTGQDKRSLQLFWRSEDESVSRKIQGSYRGSMLCSSLKWSRAGCREKLYATV
jgi:hypothetical protein